jgi:hypothetical protein
MNIADNIEQVPGNYSGPLYYSNIVLNIIQLTTLTKKVNLFQVAYLCHQDNVTIAVEHPLIPIN